MEFPVLLHLTPGRLAGVLGDLHGLDFDVLALVDHDLLVSLDVLLCGSNERFRVHLLPPHGAKRRTMTSDTWSYRSRPESRLRQVYGA